MKLLTNDTAAYRGMRTGIQALVGFVVGLFFVVWNTPGVPQAVQDYLKPYEVELLIWLGIPTVIGAGLFGYLTTLYREKQQAPVNPVVDSPAEPLAETGTPPTE